MAVSRLATIPELVEQICADQPPATLAACARVSQLWGAIALDILWRPPPKLRYLVAIYKDIVYDDCLLCWVGGHR